MIISVEYVDGVLKVTPPLDPARGKKLAEIVFELAGQIDDGRIFYPGEIIERLQATGWDEDE